LATENALDVVSTVVSDLAEELGYEQLREPTAESLLFGGEDGIDSLSLVRLVADVERLAERRFGKRIVLADDRAMSRRSSPFRTVGTLSELLEERLGEADA
jgi:acyl carrier protein